MACFFFFSGMHHPKGYLIAIGGAEDKGSDEEREKQKKVLAEFKAKKQKEQEQLLR